MKILLTLLFGFPLFTPDPPPSPSPASAIVWEPICRPAPSAPTRRIIVDGPSRIEFDATGRVWLSPGMKLTEAARLFWGSLDAQNPLRPEVDRLRAENARLRGQCGGQK